MIDVVLPLPTENALRAIPLKVIAAVGEADAVVLQKAKEYIEFVDCDNIIYVVLSGLIVAGSAAAARLLEHNGTGFQRHSPGDGRNLWTKMTALFKDGSVAHKLKLKRETTDWFTTFDPRKEPIAQLNEFTRIMADRGKTSSEQVLDYLEDLLGHLKDVKEYAGPIKDLLQIESSKLTMELLKEKFAFTYNNYIKDETPVVVPNRLHSVGASGSQDSPPAPEPDSSTAAMMSMFSKMIETQQSSYNNLVNLMSALQIPSYRKSCVGNVL